MTYNPADYKAVQDKAKAMSKQELEEYYVDKNNKSHKSCGDGIAIFIGISMLIFLIGAIGYCIAEDNLSGQVEDSIVEISNEICPIIGTGYSSQKVLKSSYLQNKIICNWDNSNPNPLK